MTMRFILAFVAAVFAFSVEPVSAQDFVDRITGEFTTCLDASDAGIVATTIPACEAAHSAIEQLQALHAQGPGEERDYAWFTRAVIQITLGASYLTVDGVRSARSCHAAELFLQYFGNVGPTFPFPEDLAAAREGSYDPVRVCRTDFGRPWWGLEIP